MDRDQPQQDELARGGDTLRRARLARRLSLDDIAQATRIRKPLLAALERGELSAYRSSVYAVGHLRIYARLLEVDPEPYVKLLLPPREELPTPITSHVGPRRAFPAMRLGGPTLVLAAVVALAMYLFQQYATFNATGDPSAPRPSESSLLLATPIPTLTAMPMGPAPMPTPTATRLLERSIVVVAPTATVVPTLLPTATPPPTSTSVSGVKIDATMLGRVWLQVEADGRIAFSGILNAGDNRSWSASREIMLWAGDAANVSVIFNGKSLGRLGTPGQVLKVTWTATS
jgi:transcriptional regulator with XRE-family HTH domain